MVRQLSAIMFADMVGFTALMQEDERGAKSQRDRQRQVLNDRVAEFEGKILQYYGDGALSIFQSAIQAVNCAVAIQEDLAKEPRVPLRIGIHIGDIVHDQEGVYGDGVNVASRIQDLSIPGGILISGNVAEEVKNHSDISTEPLGEYRLKNVQRPHAVFAVTNPGIAVPTPRDVKGWPEADAKKWARRRKIRLVGVLAGIGAIAGVSYWAFADAGESAEDPLIGLPPAFERVAVLPFDVPGTDSRHLGQIFQLHLSTLLEGDVFHSVPPGEVNRLLIRSQVGETSSPEVGTAIAQQTSADLFATGTVLTVGESDSLTVAAELWDLEPGVVASAHVTGTWETASAISDSLARQLLMEHSQTDPTLLRDLPSESIDALKLFFDGNDAYLAADYVQAVDHLESATAMDEDFALAHYRLSQAATWAWEWGTNRTAIARALENTSRLSTENIQLVYAWNDFLAPNPPVAEDRYRDLTQRDPNLIEAWNGLGEALIHFNLLRGRPTDEARRHFERVLEIEPNYGEARYHMLEFAARDRDKETFDSLMEGVNPASNQHLAWRAVRAFGFGTAVEQNQIEAELRGAPEAEVVLAISRVLSNLHDFPAAERLAYLLTRSDRDPEWQNEVHGLFAALKFAQGQWDATKDELDLIRRDDAERGVGWALEMEALFSTFPLLNVPRDEMTALREKLIAWDWNTAPQPKNWALFASHYPDHEALRLYCLGLLSLAIEDKPEYYVHLGNLANYGNHPEARDFGNALWQSLRARDRLQEADTANARAQFATLEYFPRLELVPASPFYSRALDRWLHAEILRTMGQDRDDPELLEDALDWYETLSDGWGEFLLAAPAHLRQGEIHEALGNRREAISHYRRFEELWKNAGEPLAILVTDAERTRTTLEAQGGG